MGGIRVDSLFWDTAGFISSTLQAVLGRFLREETLLDPTSGSLKKGTLSLRGSMSTYLKRVPPDPNSH